MTVLNLFIRELPPRPARQTFWRWILAGGAYALLATLAACAPVGPDYQPPQQELPPSWSHNDTAIAQPLPAEKLDRWWTLFDDPTLTSLIERANRAAPDIRIAAARIAQARAQYRITSAAQFPGVTAQGDYSSSRKSANVSGSSSGTTQELFQANFDATWEVDVFGGIRRSREEAEARFGAAWENGNAMRISLAAEVARNYLTLRGSQERLTISLKNIDILQQTLDLAKGRFASGLGNRLEVAQAETQLNLSKAQLPSVQNTIGQTMQRLALLLGLPPQGLTSELTASQPLPQLPLLLPQTLPSELLRRRPDIRQAERELAAATAAIGVATAELFPHFSLTALIGLQSNHLDNLLSSGSRYWSTGPAVRWSLFNGGQVRANIDLQQGRREEIQAAYEKTVLTALNETESALLALVSEANTRAALVTAVTTSQRAVELASGRYRSGLTDFLEVLLSERTFFQLQDQLLLSQQQTAINMVALFKALGGGWPLDTESAPAVTATP